MRPETGSDEHMVRFSYGGFLRLKWKLKFVGNQLYYQHSDCDLWFKCGTGLNGYPDLNRVCAWWFRYVVERK